MKLEFSWRIFEKYSSIKFHGNPSTGGRVVPCGRTERRTADITKLILAFRNSANAPKNEELMTVIIGTVTEGRTLKILRKSGKSHQITCHESTEGL